MKYVHRFRVDSPVEEVAAFHRRASGMGTLTPPPVIVRLHHAPVELGEGDEMVFTLWIGPLPVHWRARIDQVSPTGFRDRQVEGPFASWVHRHRFVRLDPHQTEIVDEVEATLSQAWPRRLLPWFMWVNMPLFFAYRTWKTRRILRRQGTHDALQPRTE